MLNKKIRFIKIDPNYIKYLNEFDSKVQFNQKELKKDNKPFVGILFSINDIPYYVPITSADKKEKLNHMYKSKRKPIDIIFIVDKNNELLAVLNLNNMIPIVESSIIYYDIMKDKNASLLLKEYQYCIKHQREIRERAKKIYNMVKLHTQKQLENRCCNFRLLEEKCKKYREKDHEML